MWTRWDSRRNATICPQNSKFKGQNMQVELAAFRALVSVKAGDVRAVAEKNGFRVEVGAAQLGTEQGQPRVFKNLTTLARFAKAQGASILTMKLDEMPKRRKTVAKAAQAEKKTPAKTAAKKQATA